MDDDRRLALLRRQHTLAQIARREAMAGLADALEQRARSADIAARSRSLAETYARRSPPNRAGILREEAAFRTNLTTIAADAERASGDASDQVRWQGDMLAAAEHRAQALDDRLKAQQRAIENTRIAREQASEAGLARKVQRRSHTASQPDARSEPSN